MRREQVCSEWTGLTLGELKEAQGSCNDPGAKFGSGKCPSQKLLGTCAHPEEKVKIYIYESEAAHSVADAKEICDDGQFVAAR